jgi:AraC-like DNA-binding protein
VHPSAPERDVLADILDTTGLQLAQIQVLGGGQSRLYGPALYIVERGTATIGGQKLENGGAVLRMTAQPEVIEVTAVDARVIAVRYRFSRPLPHPFFDRLPRRMPLAGNAAASVLDLGYRLAEETISARPGWRVVLTGLTRSAFIEHLRCYESAATEDEFLNPLSDESMYRALQNLHEDPGHDWTSEELAKTVGMSRATFYRRFTALIGVAPAKYLAHWRLSRALLLLGEGRFSVTEVAERFGYGSGAAFSRAFKRYAGAPPTDMLVHAERWLSTVWTREVTKHCFELRKELGDTAS